MTPMMRQPRTSKHRSTAKRKAVRPYIMNAPSYTLNTLLILTALITFFITGCEESRDPLFSSPSSKQDDPETKALAKDILALEGVRLYEELKTKKGQELKADEAVATYHDAMQRLIRRGSSIETKLMESLLTSTDWGVRLGLIEVMQATATKRSVSTIIQVLDDPQPLVAMNADLLLREMTKHQVIPDAGQAPIDGLAAPVTTDANDQDPDATLKAWSAWHADNKIVLKQHWTDWWEKNKSTVKID